MGLIGAALFSGWTLMFSGPRPDTNEVLSEQQRERIARLVDTFPPLSPEQRTRLAGIFASERLAQKAKALGDRSRLRNTPRR
jgi:hypothetical protein